MRFSSLGRRQQPLTSAKAEIEKEARASEGFKCLTFQADITDASAMDHIFEKVVSSFGKNDVVISNAAYLNQTLPIAESDLDDYWRSFEVNVKGSVIVA